MKDSSDKCKPNCLERCRDVQIPEFYQSCFRKLVPGEEIMKCSRLNHKKVCSDECEKTNNCFEECKEQEICYKENQDGDDENDRERDDDDDRRDDNRRDDDDRERRDDRRDDERRDDKRDDHEERSEKRDEEKSEKRDEERSERREDNDSDRNVLESLEDNEDEDLKHRVYKSDGTCPKRRDCKVRQVCKTNCYKGENCEQQCQLKKVQSCYLELIPSKYAKVCQNLFSIKEYKECLDECYYPSSKPKFIQRINNMVKNIRY